MPALADLTFPQLRLTQLWRWKFTSQAIAEMMDMPSHTIADMARRLREHGFDLPKHDVGRIKVSQRQRRACLRCERQFASLGFQNRICPPCKRTEEWGDMSDEDDCGVMVRLGGTINPRHGRVITATPTIDATHDNL